MIYSQYKIKTRNKTSIVFWKTKRSHPIAPIAFLSTTIWVNYTLTHENISDPKNSPPNFWLVFNVRLFNSLTVKTIRKTSAVWRLLLVTPLQNIIGFLQSFKKWRSMEHESCIHVHQLKYHENTSSYKKAALADPFPGP